MRVKLIIGWLYAVILCLIYGLLLSAYGFLLCFPDPFDAQKSSFILLLFFLTLTTVFVGCCFGISWLCRKRNLDSRGYWRFALLVLLTIPVACLMHDASPIEHDYNDYSMKDIVPGDQKILASYDTLMLFRKDGGMKVGTVSYYGFMTNFAIFLTNALVNSESISRTWDDTAEARSVIERLDAYPGIADLTPQVQLGTNMPMLDFMVIRSVSWTYTAYAGLKAAEGHPEEAARHLAKFQSVARKALPYSALPVDKMVWIATTRNNIQAAFAIMQQSQCNPETLKILKEAFLPLSEEDFSMRRVFIGLYVWHKTFLGAQLRPSTFLNAFVMTRFGKLPKSPSFFRKAVAFFYYLTFRQNRTFRDCRKQTDLIIEWAGKHPPDISIAEVYVNNYSRNLDIRNLGGWYITYPGLIPSYIRCAQTAANTKVLSDLLAIEIGDRLNQPVVLDDYYSGGPYGRDKRTGRAFSVGPDKKPNTDDDILLGKK